MTSNYRYYAVMYYEKYCNKRSNVKVKYHKPLFN